MRRAYIMVELNNGVRIKYVRDVVADTNGVAGKYYAFTGETGDELADQTGAGKVIGDFETLVTKSQGVPGTDFFLEFPESTGDTEFLSRPFYDQGLGRESIMVNYVPLQSISRIFVVEEWMNVDNNL